MMRDQEGESVFAPGETADAASLSRFGLLQVGEGCMISPLAVFVPADARGVTRPVEIGASCQVGPFAVVYGGTVIRDEARLEEHVIVGKFRCDRSGRRERWLHV